MHTDARDKLVGELGEEGLLLVREAADMIVYYRKLLERFELDALTGLPGQSKFREFTTDIEQRTQSVGVIFFDVNNLKEVNDEKGHHAGDLLLQKAAESILPLIHERAHAFRVGGDEFAVLLPGCCENDIENFLARWREKLAALNTKNDGLPCSVAVGAAFASAPYRFSEVLTLADERMYTQKRAMKSGG